MISDSIYVRRYHLITLKLMNEMQSKLSYDHRRIMNDDDKDNAPNEHQTQKQNVKTKNYTFGLTPDTVIEIRATRLRTKVQSISVF